MKSPFLPSPSELRAPVYAAGDRPPSPEAAEATGAKDEARPASNRPGRVPHVQPAAIRLWLPALLALLGASLEIVADIPVPWWIGLLGGGLVGLLYETRRVAAADRRNLEELGTAYLRLAEKEAAVRQELFGVTQGTSAPFETEHAPPEVVQPPAELIPLRPPKVVLDESVLVVVVNGASVQLTRNQFSLLRCLVAHPREWVSASQLQKEALKAVAHQDDASNVRYHIHQLRARLAQPDPAFARWVHSEPGLGYMWSVARCDRRHCAHDNQTRHSDSSDDLVPPPNEANDDLTQS